MRWKYAFLCVFFLLVATLAQAEEVYYPDFGHTGPGWDGERPHPESPKKKEKESDLSLPSPKLLGTEESTEESVDETNSEVLEIWHSKPRSYSHSFEWLAIQAGMGFVVLSVKESYYDRTGPILVEGYTGPLLLKTDIQLFNLQMGRFYLTCLELHPNFFIGFFGAGLRLGYRLPLRDDFRNELRFGSYLGGDQLPFFYGASFMPYVQFIHNRPRYSIGAGVDVPILIIPTNASSYYKRGTSNFAGGLIFYIRLAFGRLLFSIQEDDSRFGRSYDLLQER